MRNASKQSNKNEKKKLEIQTEANSSVLSNSDSISHGNHTKKNQQSE